MAEIEPYEPYAPQAEADTSYPPYILPDEDPNHPNLIRDKEKARFVAYAEKPFQDEARGYRDKGNEEFIMAVEESQAQGNKREAYTAKVQLNDAVGRMAGSEELLKEADQIGRVAAKVYDQNNR